LLARDQTRLERKHAEADERARAIEAQTQQLSQHAEELHEQERAVADRRLEIDHHLVEMRDWYRRKLRELAGIPLTPDGVTEAPLTILPLPATPDAQEVTTEEGDVGIIPTMRSILSLGGAVEQGDQKLGQVLRDSSTMTRSPRCSPRPGGNAGRCGRCCSPAASSRFISSPSSKRATSRA
jgi:hypothetical protein